MYVRIVDYLLSESYGCELEFLAELFWIVDSSSINEDRLSHVFGEVFWCEFFEFFPLGYEDAAVCLFQAFNS
jgi:hypothetical protein